MSWLSKWVKNRSGEGQKVDLAAQQTRFDDSMKPTTDRYDAMYDMGKEDTNLDSTNNMAVQSQMQAMASDNSSEASRLAQRNIAMGGGGNATATAFNVADQANKASATAQEGFNNYYQNARQGGLETMAGATANNAQIANNKFNMYESGMERNKEIDAHASKWKANALMGGIGVAGNLMMGNPMGAVKSANGMMGMQKGGGVSKEDFAPHMMYKGDNEKMANTYEQHLQYKNDGYGHSQGMQKGGLLTKAYQYGGEVEEFVPVGNGMSDEQASMQGQGMLGYAMGGEVDDMNPAPNRFNIPTRLGGQIIE